MSGGIAQHGAMLGGDGEAGAKQAIDIGQAAPRDQRQRPLHAVRQPVQEPVQMRRHNDGIRCVGKVEQCSVDIQKDGTTTQRRSLRRAIFHGLNVAARAQGHNPLNQFTSKF